MSEKRQKNQWGWPYGRAEGEAREASGRDRSASGEARGRKPGSEQLMEEVCERENCKGIGNESRLTREVLGWTG